MNGKGKKSEHDRRDWTIILIILLFGFLCMIVAGGQAIRFASNWKLDTNMRSNLDPDSDFLTNRPINFFGPIDPSILTQPAWANVFLTPGAVIETREPAQVTDMPATTVTITPTLFQSPTATSLVTSTPTATFPSPTNTFIYYPPPPATVTPKPPRTNTPVPSTVPVDLQITKTDGTSTYMAGSSVTYTIVVTNLGSNSVTGATISDPKPAQVVDWGWCAGTCTPTTFNSANINITLNLAPSASATYTVQANINSGATGDLVNIASIGVPAGYTDTVPGNNSETDTDTFSLPADLSITKDDGVTNVNPGASINYTVRVTNNGPSSVTGATLNDPVASGLSKTAVICSSTPGQCVAPPTVAELESGTFTLPTLNSGQFYEITISTTVTAISGNVTNTATVTAPSGITDPTPGNNSMSDTDTVNIVADLSITKTDGDTDYVGNVLKTYTITVSNAGPSNVTGATVTDLTLTNATNSNLVGSSWSCSSFNGGSCSPAIGIGNINNTVNLPSGSSVTYTVIATVVPSPSGPLVNTATVTAPAGITDLNLGNNSATDSDALIIPDAPPPQIGGPPNNDPYPLLAGGSLTLSVNLLADGDPDWDLVYYEYSLATLPPPDTFDGIWLDWMIIEISDGSNWYRVFNWGDNSRDTNSNVDYAFLSLPVPPPNPEEMDQRPIASSDLYLSSSGWQTGIAIDIDSFVPLGTYTYIRFIAPPGDADGQTEIDGVEILPP
jgi:uncharacterized repeat protein (TIGR01451 family)